MPNDGVPPSAIAEPVDARQEHVTTHVDEGDEAFLSRPKEEEGGKAVPPKQVGVTLAEVDDLALRQNEVVGIAERLEHFPKRRIRTLVRVHFPDVDLGRRGCNTPHISTPPLEVGIEETLEHLR